MRRKGAASLFVALAAALVHCGGDDAPGPPVVVEAGSDAPADGPAIDAGADTSEAATLAPTEPQVLATSTGKDEDPSILLAADGRFYVAWYSNRDGHDRIYIKSSTNGRDWTPDRAITPTGEANFYPSLIQTKDGRFHLAMFRGSASDAGKILGAIRYTTSLDTMTWTPAVSITDASALAWVPTLTERTPGTMFMTWASDTAGDKDIYVASSVNGGASWGAPAKLTDNAFNDDLPFITTRPDGSLILVWGRFDLAETSFKAPFTHPSNELVYATSVDGTTWSAPIAITADAPGPAIADVIGSVFPSNDPTGLSVVWASVRGTSGSGDISTLGLSAVPATGTNVKQLTNAPGSDYSARVIPTGVPGLYMMAWVSDRAPLADGGENLDIYVQLLRP
jgi:hypothetical protein